MVQATTITQASFPYTITNDGINNTIINLSSTGDFDVQDNGTSALFVRDDANVGIGTNAPGNKLEVVKGVVGQSGLRLTSFASTSAANKKPMAVDNLGDVIDGTRANATAANVVAPWTNLNNILNFTATGRSYLLIYSASISSSTVNTLKNLRVMSGVTQYAITNFYFTNANVRMQISGSAIITPPAGAISLQFQTNGSSDANDRGTITIIEQ